MGPAWDMQLLYIGTWDPHILLYIIKLYLKRTSLISHLNLPDNLFNFVYAVFLFNIDIPICLLTLNLCIWFNLILRAPCVACVDILPECLLKAIVNSCIYLQVCVGHWLKHGAFHPSIYVCTSVRDKELLSAYETCALWSDRKWLTQNLLNILILHFIST